MKKLFVLFIIIISIFFSTTFTSFAQDSLQIQEIKTHTVVRGDTLIGLGEQYGIPWEYIFTLNETLLAEKYPVTCKGFKKPGDKKYYFCNDSLIKQPAHTLKPGWVLELPQKVVTPTPPPAPELQVASLIAVSSTPSETTIQEVVEQVKTKKVAIVIDDTGSIENNRELIGRFYVQEIEKYQKGNVLGVYLYADEGVRKCSPNDNIRFETNGMYENTYDALLTASQEKPDAIILITDEPGDDWNWNAVKQLPPIYAHCITDEEDYNSCEKNLRLLSNTVPGSQYIPINPDQLVGQR